MAEGTTSILLIDDNPGDARLIAEYLAEAGECRFDLATADRLSAGLGQLSAGQFDVVLVDLGLPDSSGLDSLRAVRAEAPHVAVIVLTGLDDEGLANQAVREGAQDYLVKGQVDGNILSRSIRYAVERKRAEEELQRHRDHLEVLVAERTEELAEANQQLQEEMAERRQAEERIEALNAELNQRVIELEAVNAELEVFSYSVSHDLRAPLRSMDGFSGALLQDYGDKLDEEGRSHLERIRRASQRMGRLIDDLLELSRIARQDMRRESVDLSALAGEIAAELQESQPDRDVDLGIADGLTATGDSSLLRVALQNLLDNAWKFTSPHPRAKIELGVTEADGERAYFVRDDGVGFDMAYAEKLFQPFRRLHSDAEFEGTGIGLATVQRIIKRHGGSVWVEAEVEQGCSVYFTL
jgi:signal transduction histidine kinase